MKLNEKDLSKFASCSSPIDKEGCLQKKGSTPGASYQKRWFVLKGNLLFYFEKRHDKEPIGLIILENCQTVRDSTQKLGFYIQFNMVHSREYHFQTEFEEDMISWMKAIDHANYDCLRKLVDKLESKLDFILKNQEMCDASLDDNQNSDTISSIPKGTMVVPGVPMKEKNSSTTSPISLIDFSDPTPLGDNEIDDEMLLAQGRSNSIFRTSSETNLAAIPQFEKCLTSSIGSTDVLNRKSSFLEDPLTPLTRGTLFRGPIVSLIMDGHDSKTSTTSNYSPIETINSSDALIEVTSDTPITTTTTTTTPIIITNTFDNTTTSRTTTSDSDIQNLIRL